MYEFLKSKTFYCLLFISLSTPFAASAMQCVDVLSPPKTSEQSTNSPTWSQKLIDYIPTAIQRTKAFAVDKALDMIAIKKGIPKYLKDTKKLLKSESYLKYDNFGEMGLAEIGISVRVNQQKLQALNTERPLIIVANHPLGIADGLSLQYLSGSVRKNTPSLLMLARWIEKLLPHAIFGDDKGWGTAIPVEINKPDPSSPLYESQMSEIKAFNSKWSRVTLRALQKGASVIIFPAGQVANIKLNDKSYPHNIQDAPESWQNGVLNLAKLGRADVVFAKIDAVNSQSFYKNRKRFGGADKERVIWFFSEALAKKDKTIDVYLSDPLSLTSVYEKLSQVFGIPEVEIQSNDGLATELMRRLTHDINIHFPQALNDTHSPRKLNK